MVTMVASQPRSMSTEANIGEPQSTCCHHWVIESPNGPSSRGVCKFCKEERAFNNSADRYVIKKK